MTYYKMNKLKQIYSKYNHRVQYKEECESQHVQCFSAGKANFILHIYILKLLESVNNYPSMHHSHCQHIDVTVKKRIPNYHTEGD